MSATATPSRILRGRTRPYAPPPGYYDMPYTWIYDGSGLTPEQNYFNQQVPIYAGYGDFILRRIIGMDRVLFDAPYPLNGRFQVRRSNGAYIQSVPQNVGSGGPGILSQNSADQAILRELLYKENSQIAFDLYSANPATDFGGVSNFSAQIGFQGVRRLPGVSPLQTTISYRPKPYTYVSNFTLQPSTAALSLAQINVTPVSNYDFELWEIRIVYTEQAHALMTGEGAGLITFVAVPLGTAGNGIQVVLVAPPTSALTPGGFVANVPFSITVSGTVITVQGASDPNGFGVTTANAIAAAINLMPAAAALVNAVCTSPIGPEDSYIAGTYTLLGGGSQLNPTQSAALLQLFDQNSVACSYSPMCDLFMNSLSGYGNGAVVPPLFYQANSRIQLNSVSLIGDIAANMTVHFIGRQRIPC
jgi:hypothetical protein